MTRTSPVSLTSVEDFERVFNDVGDALFVVAAAFEFDEFLDAPCQFGIHWCFFNLFHVLLRGEE